MKIECSNIMEKCSAPYLLLVYLLLNRNSRSTSMYANSIIFASCIKSLGGILRGAMKNFIKVCERMMESGLLWAN